MRIAASRLAVVLGAAVLLAGDLAPVIPAAARATQCKAGLDTVAGLIEKADANATDAAGKSAVRQAREHYKAAKKAHKVADDQTCIAELDAATAALK